MNIVKVNTKNLQATKLYLVSNKDTSLFLLGNLENFGLSDDFCLYQIIKDDVIIGIIGHSFNSLITLCIDLKQVDYFILNQFLLTLNQTSISIAGSNIAGLLAIYTYRDQQNSTMLLAKLNPSKFKPSTLTAKILTSDMFYAYVDQIHTINFGSSNYQPTKESILEKLHKNKDNETVLCILDDKGTIIAGATLTSICPYTAILVGVWTDKNHRKKGLATTLVSELITLHLDQNRSFYLFYNNPIAASIYLKLGFEAFTDCHILIPKEIPN